MLASASLLLRSQRGLSSSNHLPICFFLSKDAYSYLFLFFFVTSYLLGLENFEAEQLSSANGVSHLKGYRSRHIFCQRSPPVVVGKVNRPGERLVTNKRRFSLVAFKANASKLQSSKLNYVAIIYKVSMCCNFPIVVAQMNSEPVLEQLFADANRLSLQAFCRCGRPCAVLGVMLLKYLPVVPKRDYCVRPSIYHLNRETNNPLLLNIAQLVARPDKIRAQPPSKFSTM